MKECIDIYSRLIIATITFVVPIIIALLSTFTAGEKRRKELASTSQAELSKQLAEEVQTNPEAISAEIIHKTSEQYKQIEKNTKSELALLNPLAQFWRIFVCLALALILLLFYYLIVSNSWNIYNHRLSTTVILLSGGSYALALFFIIRVFKTIIKTKKIIESI